MKESYQKFVASRKGASILHCEIRTYVPPRDREFKKEARRRGQSGGNHISPLAKVTSLNGKPVEARLYRGGHPDDSIELLSKIRLRDFLGVSDGAEVIVTIEEHEPNA